MRIFEKDSQVKEMATVLALYKIQQLLENIPKRQCLPRVQTTDLPRAWPLEGIMEERVGQKSVIR